MSAATYDRTRKAVVLDLGKIEPDAGLIAAVQAWIQRTSDKALQSGEIDAISDTKALRKLFWALDDAQREQRAHERETTPLFRPSIIPTVEPLTCEVVQLQAWRNA